VQSTVESIADIESTGEVVLKGIRRPVVAFNIIAIR
jgi:hypothetical protein